MLALTCWLAAQGAAGSAMAQDTGVSMPDGPVLTGAEYVLDDRVGVSTLAPSPPAPLPGAAGAADVAAPDVPPVLSDAAIGLIEAPDGALGVPAESLPDAALRAGGAPLSAPENGFSELGQVFSPVVSNFIEPQARLSVFGPVDHPPVVIELFTSQGCSSCPPADEMLADLADRDDVLALSWHVDYWDYLGWADAFARPEFTLRQQAYAHQSGERAIYTPQMIVGGTDTLIAPRPAELMGLLKVQMARPSPVIVSSSREKDGFRIELTPRAAIPDRVAIILIRYAPSRNVRIKAGENRGIEVAYRNVVLASERVAEWDGRAPLRINVSPDKRSGTSFLQDTRHAILAQELGRAGGQHSASGPILAAIRLD